MQDNETTRIDMVEMKKAEVNSIMLQVLTALQEKGYNPVSQVAGYFLSDDPTYITNHNNARGIIRRMERDELLEEVLRFYFNSLK